MAGGVFREKNGFYGTLRLKVAKTWRSFRVPSMPTEEIAIAAKTAALGFWQSCEAMPEEKRLSLLRTFLAGLQSRDPREVLDVRISDRPIRMAPRATLEETFRVYGEAIRAMMPLSSIAERRTAVLAVFAANPRSE